MCNKSAMRTAKSKARGTRGPTRHIPRETVFDNSLGAAAGEAKIIVVADDDDCSLVELERLPAEATVLFRGSAAEDFSTPEGKQALADSNVLLFCAGEWLMAGKGTSGHVPPPPSSSISIE